MVTNKKLLEELTNQSQVNNEALREQLRSYIQTVEETQKSTVLSIHEQLEEIRVQQDAMNCHNEQKMETLSHQVVSDLYQKVSKYTQSSLNPAPMSLPWTWPFTASSIRLLSRTAPTI